MHTKYLNDKAQRSFKTIGLQNIIGCKKKLHSIIMALSFHLTLVLVCYKKINLPHYTHGN